MRYAMLLAVVVGTPSLGVGAAPPPKESQVVRPVMWWSGLNRVSDGGGPGLKPSTGLITDAKAFLTLWKQLELKGNAPGVNFKNYFVLVDFRRFGLDFTLGGGLAVDDRGDAKAQKDWFVFEPESGDEYYPTGGCPIKG